MKLALCLTLAMSAWLLHPTEARPDTTADCSHIQAMPGSITKAIRSGEEHDDVLVIAPSTQGRVLLCYHNHPAKVSRDRTVFLPFEGIEAVVHVIVGRGLERVVVTPPDGWMVYPADLADAEVMDGEAVTVMLFAGMM